MTLAVKPKQMKLLLLAAGILGLTLRAVLYTAGVDEKGLLISGYWAGAGIFLLSAAAAAVLFAWCRRLNGPQTYSGAFPASVFSAVGAILAGVSFLLAGDPEAPSGPIAAAAPALRFAAAGSLILIAYCRFTGKKPLCIFHSCVCLHLALRLVCQYRIWSVDPQLQNYCFYLGAHIALMLTAYQLAAFDAGIGSHRSLWGCGLAAVYLCMLSLVPGEEPFFLICCAVWVLSNLSSLTRKRQPKFATDRHTTQEDSL